MLKMLAVVITITPAWGILGFLTLTVLFAFAAAGRDSRGLSSWHYILATAISSLCVFFCMCWGATVTRQQNIENLGEWKDLYQLVEGEHSALQEKYIELYLESHPNLEPMNDKAFTFFMKETNDVGADLLINFVEETDPAAAQAHQTAQRTLQALEMAAPKANMGGRASRGLVTESAPLGTGSPPNVPQ